MASSSNAVTTATGYFTVKRQTSQNLPFYNLLVVENQENNMTDKYCMWVFFRLQGVQFGKSGG